MCMYHANAMCMYHANAMCMYHANGIVHFSFFLGWPFDILSVLSIFSKPWGKVHFSFF
jgi:hypothetical protein